MPVKSIGTERSLGQTLRSRVSKVSPAALGQPAVGPLAASRR